MDNLTSRDSNSLAGLHNPGHDAGGLAVVRVGAAGRTEPKMALATIPFPAKPMEKKTGLSRPGTFTRTTSIEYAGEVAGHAVRPWRTRQ